MHNMWRPKDEQRLGSTLRCVLVILDDSVDTTLEDTKSASSYTHWPLGSVADW